MEEEEVRRFRAPPGLPDPLVEEMTIGVPMPALLGCQTGVTAKAESQLHQRYNKMNDKRPCEGLVSEQISDDLSDQTRASQSCIRHPGEVTNQLPDLPRKGG